VIFIQCFIITKRDLIINGIALAPGLTRYIGAIDSNQRIFCHLQYKHVVAWQTDCWKHVAPMSLLTMITNSKENYLHLKFFGLALIILETKHHFIFGIIAPCCPCRYLKLETCLVLSSHARFYAYLELCVSEKYLWLFFYLYILYLNRIAAHCTVLLLRMLTFHPRLMLWEVLLLLVPEELR